MSTMVHRSHNVLLPSVQYKLNFALNIQDNCYTCSADLRKNAVHKTSDVISQPYVIEHLSWLALTCATSRSAEVCTGGVISLRKGISFSFLAAVLLP